MSMYLSNSDLRPTGNEPAEFIDTPVMSDDATGVEPRLEANRAAHTRLTNEARIDITRLTEQYIGRLVQKYNGDREDVRAIIHELTLRG